MTFSAAWLDLREPADHAARDAGLLARARACLGNGLAVDLGCGTGSTVRAFAGGRWRLVDRDEALLRVAAARAPDVETVAADLTNLSALPIDGARLVTASALFDLVSRDWIDALADRLAAHGAALYAALSYDGAMDWTPALPEDADVTAAFNAHQHGDKGFGPALGPDATAALADALTRRGYDVATAPSPWRLGPDQRDLQAELNDGIGEATARPAWAQARRAALDSTRCSVGHADLLAIPGAPSAQSKITSRSNP